MNKLKKTVSIGMGAGGAISAVCGLITDFLLPIAPYGLYIGFIGLLVLLISIVLFFIPSTDSQFRKLFGEVWYLPSFLLLFVFTTSMFTVYYLGKASPEGEGILASNFEELSNLQVQILETNKAIEENTRDVAKNTKVIAQTVKKETSDDPRKELANMGLQWNQSTFFDAIVNNDPNIVDLFIKGGLKLNKQEFSGDGLNALIASDISNDQLIRVINAGAIDRRIINISTSAIATENVRLRNYADNLGKKYDFSQHGEYITSFNVEFRPIMVAILLKKKNLVSLLIEHGASIEEYCGAHLKTGECVFKFDVKKEMLNQGLS